MLIFGKIEMIQQAGKKYMLENKRKIYLPEGEVVSFTYSDGEAIEKNLLKVIEQAKDLSLGSPELNSHINDWPSRYHLSAQRADLLRPLADLLKGSSVLEIGSGCGAISRYLGEISKGVVALEGSPRRAATTAARCRDLKNVKVYCDNFSEFGIPQKFDVVTLIGVLEYSRIYITSEDPVQDVLKKAKSYLKPKGVLIIAIENQLGLKYFAGAPEDHLGKPYIGIENGYSEKGPVTFGKKALNNLIREAGYKNVEFLYPFPDYKLPLAIISEYAEKNKSLNLSDILKYKIDHKYSDSLNRTIDTEKAIHAIVENELISDLSNSFLVVAGVNENKNLDPKLMAYTFSNSRKKEFCKLNKILLEKKEYLVKREKTYPDSNSKSLLVQQVLNDEKYLPGSLYVNGLIKIVSVPGWSIEQIAEWAKPWVDYLINKTIGTTEDGIALVEGKYFDATPFNIIINETKKEYTCFDLEWTVKENLSVDYIIFRGLYYSLYPLELIAKSSSMIYSYLADICKDVIQTLFPKNNIKKELYELTEKKILTELIEKLPEFMFSKNLHEDPLIIEFDEKSNINQDLLYPLSNIAVQVFWANSPLGFSEKESLSETVLMQFDPTLVSFKIPPQTAGINYLRFDLGNKPGLLNINKIEIKDNKGEIIKVWDKYAISGKFNLLLLENEVHWPNKTIQLATSIDPHIILTTNEKIKAESSKGFKVEVSISELNPSQIEILNLHTLPLSFITEKQFSELQSNSALLSSANQQLLADALIGKDRIDGLVSENKSQAINREELITLIGEVKSEKNALNEDKLLLTNEIKLKNETIKKIEIEKEKGKNDFIHIEKQVTLKTDKINDLEAVLLTLKGQINELNLVKQQQGQELTKIPALLSQLKNTEQELKKESEKLSLLEKELTLKETQLIKTQNELESNNALIIEKNHLIKIQYENEQQLILQHEKTISIISQNIISLQKELTNKQDFIQIIQSQNQEIITSLAQQEKLINDLKQNNENYELKITSLLKQVHDLTNDNALIKEEHQKQRLLQESLLSELNKNKNKLAEELNNVNQQNNYLQKKINWLDENYTHKNILNIIINRIINGNKNKINPN